MYNAIHLVCVVAIPGMRFSHMTYISFWVPLIELKQILNLLVYSFSYTNIWISDKSIQIFILY